jgi:hypothetical protein
MRFYRYLNVSFWYENKEYTLFPVDIDEDDFEVSIVTQARHPDLKRGCIGNLIYTSSGGIKPFDGEKIEGDQQDYLHNVLLKKIQVWDIDEHNMPTWKYVFEKE